MCGIAGIWSEHQPPHPDEIDRIVDTLEHRGPDDRGTYCQGPLGFGMRRLSIIDVASGRQPITNEDETLWIVFNGEIYNFATLREELKELGHNFRTQSDTEVIIHAFEQWGDECVHHLRGMFAFAIWDTVKQSLFLARDRWGIKPLFYSWDGTRLLFSSELRGITALQKTSLSYEAVSHFFSFLYFPAAHTPYREVRKLLPGHTLSLRNGALETKRYYQLPVPERIDRSVSVTEWIDRFFSTAQDCIRSHLLSEVPLGAFLSGGIDSSLVVGLMAQVLDTPVNTFSIGYEHGGEHFDERSYARRVADLFSTNHRELLVTPDTVQSRLPEILSFLDEPIGDASVIPNYVLSEFTRKYVTVALSGLGGDEVCAGYERYAGTLLAERYPFLSSVASSGPVRALVNHLPDSRRGWHLPERLKRFAEFARLPLPERYFSFVSKFTPEQKHQLFTRDVQQLLNEGSRELFLEIWNEQAVPSALSSILRMDMNTYLVDDLLALSDRTSMAHSIEMRVPFVDHVMVEFFNTVPDEFKLAKFEKKFLLKKAAERLLPRDIIYRRKAGFSVPLSVWFREGLRTFVADTLFSSSLREKGIFNEAYITHLLNEHTTRVRNHDEKIFSLLSFAVWLEKHGG